MSVLTLHARYKFVGHRVCVGLVYRCIPSYEVAFSVDIHIVNIIRAFWSIPEDFGNRGESTITKLLMRNKQWQKHHKKHQITANRMKVFFFRDVDNRRF